MDGIGSANQFVEQYVFDKVNAVVDWGGLFEAAFRVWRGTATLEPLPGGQASCSECGWLYRDEEAGRRPSFCSGCGRELVE